MRDEWLTKYKPATVTRRLALISNLYSIAIKDWQYTYIKSNPAGEISKPTINNKRDRRLITNISIIGSNSTDCPAYELDWIVRETRSKYLPTILILATETAMRRSEIVSIKLQNIDFQNGTVFLQNTKNGDDRYVPLSPLARFTLINFLNKNKPTDRLFPVSKSSVTRSFISSLRKARKRYEQLCSQHQQPANPLILQNLRFHDLRHEATSRLAEVFEMHELAKITGHKDTRMLLRYYHPDIVKLTEKLANSKHGQAQFNFINSLLLT